jgi:hypothetical protein
MEEYKMEGIIQYQPTMAWPTLIVCGVGFVVVIYIAINPYIDFQRKFFGTILITLWTIVWGLILWRLWVESYEARCWWLLLIPVTLIILYFILIVILNVETSV